MSQYNSCCKWAMPNELHACIFNRLCETDTERMGRVSLHRCSVCPRESSSSSSSSKACRFPELHRIKPFRQGRWEGRWTAGKRGRWEEKDGWMEGLEEWLIRHSEHAVSHARLPQGALHTITHMSMFCYIHVTTVLTI